MRDIAPIGDLIDHDDIKKIITSVRFRYEIKQLLKNVTDEYVNRNSYTVTLKIDYKQDKNKICIFLLKKLN